MFFKILCPGNNLTKLAIPILQEILQRNQTPLTEEEKRVKAARKVATALKSKATRERNKEKAITDRISAALSNQSPDDSSNITVPSIDTTVNSSTKPIVSRSKKTTSRVTSLTSSVPIPLVVTTPEVPMSRESSPSDTDMQTFLKTIDITMYTWLYISLTDTRSFERLITRVQPNGDNNNITTLGVIINEDVIVNRRPRDPRFFKVRMLGYSKEYVFPLKYLWITECRLSLA